MKTNPAQRGARSKNSAGIVDTIKTIIYAVLIAILVRTLAYEPFDIPSGSMIPTLLVGDYLFVSKFSYGYSRYSLPFSLPLFSGRIFFHSPERGDVAVFRVPTNPSEDYIKRIVGLPGDNIQVRRGVLYINGKPTHRKEIKNGQCPADSFAKCTLYTETFADGISHPILIRNNFLPGENTGVFHVPAHHYFMMGDNRDNSADSRFGFESGDIEPCLHDAPGALCYVPAANLVGRAEIVFFSTNGSARLWQFWNWPFSIRYDRLFHVIH